MGYKALSSYWNCKVYGQDAADIEDALITVTSNLARTLCPQAGQKPGVHLESRRNTQVNMAILDRI